MKNVIIYGGEGFIGSALARLLCENKCNVFIIEKEGIKDSNLYERIKELPITYIECNLENAGDLTQIILERDFDCFYQFVWDLNDIDGLLDYKVQWGYVNQILDTVKIAKELGCKRFVGAGSISQLDLLSKEGRNFTSDKHKYYRVAQFAIDMIGRAVGKEVGIDFFWPYITNIYGPKEIAPRLINTLVKKLSKGEGMKLTEGKQLYNFIYIDDAVRAFYLIGNSGVSGEEYLIGDGNPRPLREYMEEAEEIITGRKGLLEFCLEYNGLYPKKEYFDISALKRLGFAPEVEFKEGIKRMLGIG